MTMRTAQASDWIMRWLRSVSHVRPDIAPCSRTICFAIIETERCSCLDLAVGGTVTADIARDLSHWRLVHSRARLSWEHILADDSWEHILADETLNFMNLNQKEHEF